jgi:hypothetical protein
MAAVQEYLALLEAGKKPPRQDFLQRYPDLVEPLAVCLDGLEMVHFAAAQEKSEPASKTASADPLPHSPLGDFQIIREIGRGGMGVVYEAVQLSLGRRVALKVLPFAAAFDARQLQRFRTEAQAAALLHHTNIVPVFAVGCERGVHFYAMQLIEGNSLATLIRQSRKEPDTSEWSPFSSSSPGKAGTSYPAVYGGEKETLSGFAAALSTQRLAKPGDYYRAIAGLAKQAAEALEHAHGFGIIHRDIKPANLLVDVRGCLWVTDFGLAQMQSGAELTQTGDLLGTLRYMSPEQASGQRSLLDHRTDIYSLGATLYELTTLQPIFAGRDRQTLLHEILSREPIAPRSREKTIPLELETIILKAINKNPADRYATAREMAADLQRFLEDKPILARRPTLWDRARKWARRHPSLVGAALVVLLICMVGLFVNNQMISAEQEKTKNALERERQRAEEAERLYRQARQAVDLLVQVGEEELSDKPPVQGLRRRLLETALVFYQDFLTQRHGEDAQAELTAVRNRVRRLLDELATLQGTREHILVLIPQVQDDLELAEAHRQRLKELGKAWSEERLTTMTEFKQWTPEVRRQRFLEMARHHEKQLTEVITPQQRKRLTQIELQMKGLNAFTEPEVVTALRLTPEQRAKIRTLEEDWLTLTPGPRGPFERGGRHERGFRPWERDIKADMEKVLSWLTPEQRQRWQELIGKPFPTPMRIIFPGPGP